MKRSLLVFYKEWLNFTRSDRSVFIMYFILIAGWGALLATTGDGAGMSTPLWLVFFSVIIAANFSSSVFIAERMTGSLEILLTCGVPRSALLYGKVAFVVAITIAIGALLYLAAILIKPLVSSALFVMPGSAAFSLVFLYAAATFFNAAASAYFSVWLPNPRLLHFINLLILGCIMSAYVVLSMHFSLSLHAVTVVLVVLGGICMVLARREFESERIIKPVVL